MQPGKAPPRNRLRTCCMARQGRVWAELAHAARLFETAALSFSWVDICNSVNVGAALAAIALPFTTLFIATKAAPINASRPNGLLRMKNHAKALPPTIA